MIKVNAINAATIGSEVIAEINCKSGMESRDHLNGVSPKNQRSRGNFLMLMTVVLVLMTAFYGCKKDSGGSGGSKWLPSEIIFSDDYDFSGVAKISYDNNNRFTKVEWIYGDGDYSESIFTYDGSGRVIRITGNDRHGDNVYIWITSFTYSGNFVTITTDGEESFVAKLEGDKVMHCDYPDGEGSYTYDSKGNMINSLSEREYYYDDDNYEHGIFEISITYEDKQGICSGINMPNWFLMMYMDDLGTAVNNPYIINSRIEHTGYWNGEEHSNVYTNIKTFDYQEYYENYPAKFTTTDTREYDDNPVKKFNFLKGFNLQKKHMRKLSGDDSYVEYFEVKYIEAK